MQTSRPSRPNGSHPPGELPPSAVGAGTVVDVCVDPGNAALLLHRSAERLLRAADRPVALRSYAGALVAELEPGIQARMTMTRESRQDLAHQTLFHLHLQLHAAANIAPDRLDVWARLWHELPLTAMETATVAAELPLMNAFTARARASKPLAGSAVLVTGHFLSDLTHLVECLAALGAPLEAMTVLQKDYAYRLRFRVAAHLRDRGIHVETTANAASAVRNHTMRARRAGLTCLALDDGGYIAPVLMREPGMAEQWHGVVEQTMSGIYPLENCAASLPFPVFSVAQSRLKGRLESYWIADKAVSSSLGLLPPMKVEGQPALVIGFGNIGEQIAGRLRERRMRVAVHDTDILLLIAAHEQGYNTARDLTRLLVAHAPVVIIGATGHTSLRAEQLRALPRDCFLASVTSRDIEFDLTALRSLATSVTDLGGGSRRYAMPYGTKVTTLAEGRPVNFHESDSISNLHSDLVFASMLIGAVTVAQVGGDTSPGLDPRWADQILEGSGLLDDYYQLYGQAADNVLDSHLLHL